MSTQQEASATLVDGMTFRGTAGSGHEVMLDATPEAGGENRGFRPTEIVLVGLAGCTAMDVISLLRKMRQDVTDYHVNVRGTKSDEHPRVFTDITVEHVVTGREVSLQAVEKAVKLSWEKYCSVSAMLSKAARVTHTWRILSAETPESTSV